MSAVECNSSLCLQLLLRNNENWNQQCVNRRGRDRKEGKMPTIYSYVRVPVHWSIGNSSSNSSLASGLSSILDLAQLNWAGLVVARPSRSGSNTSQYKKNKPNSSASFAPNCKLQIVPCELLHPGIRLQTMQTSKQLAAFILLRLNAWSPNDYYCYLQQQQQQPH